MKTMDIAEFKTWAAEEIKRRLPEDYAAAEVRVRSVRKLGSSHTGLSVRRDGQSGAPEIDLDEFFKLYKSGVSADDIISYMARMAVMELPVIDESLLEDYAKVRERLFIRLSSLSRNRDLTEGIPHRVIDDMLLTYHILTGRQGSDMWSAMIDSGMLRGYGISEEQLYGDALENSSRMFPAKLDRMSSILHSSEDDDGLGMVVLTNDANSYGAAAVLYPGMLEEAAEQLGGDIYIIPSSIHEMILMPAAMVQDAERLEMTHRFLNMTEVEEKDRLSDHIYHYDDRRHLFERAGKNRE